MNAYAALKTLHVACVALSVSGFVLRFGCTIVRPAVLQVRAVRIVPHAVDTVLLVSGIVLAWQLGGAGVRAWLPAKVTALILYIVLGGIALRRGGRHASGLAAAIAALMTIAYIVAVAIRKTPVPF